MKATAIWLTVCAAAATVAFAVALELGPRDRASALAAYLSLACTLLIALLASALRNELPAASGLLHRVPRRRAAAAQPPPQLASIEQQLGAATRGALELNYRFRPFVRQIASAQLARKHGVILERQPARARELLDEQLWDFIAPETRAFDRYGPGLSMDELRRVIEQLEAI